MPKVKDEEFQKMLDEDIKDFNQGADDLEDMDDPIDYDDTDASVRLREGINPEELCSQEGFSFEVVQDKPPSQPKHYFDEFESEQSHAHWNPELNDQDNDLFYEDETFSKMADNMEDVTEAKDGGVMKRFLKQGQGLIVPKEALVRIHYNAFHERSNTPFDSSRLRGQEQRFQLGQGDVIIGMDIAVGTMKMGELSRFIVKPEYAYGEMGCGPRIPPGSTIMYEIELMNFIQATDGVEKFFALTSWERKNIPFKDIFKYVRADKEAASDYFRREMFREAISRYLRSIRVLEDMHLSNAEEEAQQQHLLRILYLNVAQCFLNTSRPNRTVTYARKALYLKEDDIKAMYKLGKAFRLLGEYEKARKHLMRAQRHKPMNKEIGDELTELEKSIKKHNDLEREQCRRMFSGVGIVDSVINRPHNNNAAQSDVPDEFKETVNKRLEDFMADKDLVEIVAGNGARLADFELGYIVETAQAMGLLYRVRKGEMILHKSPEMMEKATKETRADNMDSEK